MNLFERFLSVWVGLAMIIGVYLGSNLPSTFAFLANLEIAGINFPIAILIWIMILPMMVQIDFGSIKSVGKSPKGLLLTVVINWLIKPFTMAALAWLFFRFIYSPWVSQELADEYIAGMILLGVAPCTAMVFVWSHLTKGDANYTLVQVSVNDLIMVFAFAPISAFLLGVSDIHVPWETLLYAVTLYIILPLIAGILIRHRLLKKGENHYQKFCDFFKPFSMLGLVLTVVVLFGLQANTLLSKGIDILLIAIPLIIQSFGIFALTYWMARKLKLPYSVAAPASLIGTSNFFELAVAVAIALFGLQSGAVLATVVGVLVEVPVMLMLVHFANNTQHWFKPTDTHDL